MITGKTIKNLRENKNISQEKLANMVGISQAHIAKIENEKVNPTLSTINKLLSILKEENKIKCSSLMQKKIIYVSSRDKVKNAVRLMKAFKISQLPVIDNKLSTGSITETILIQNLHKNFSKIKVRDIMGSSFPIIFFDDDVETARQLLKFHQAILLTNKGKIVGIITKSDLLDLEYKKII